MVMLNQHMLKRKSMAMKMYLKIARDYSRRGQK
jgi:hypothetical protein